MIRIPDNHLTDYLTASLGYSGTGRWHAALPNEDAALRDPAATMLLDTGLAAYRHAVGSGYPSVPFFLVLDLRLLAEFGYEFTYTERDLDGFDPMLRARYENQILNRLLREHRVQQAIELLAFHKARTGKDGDTTAFDTRADRLALILLERLAPHWPTDLVVNAAHMRGRSLELTEIGDIAKAGERWREALAEINPEAPTFEHLLDSFIHSAMGSRRGVVPVSWVQVVKPQDLFELEHLEALDREHLRMGVRHIIDVKESLPELDPHDIELREEASEVESQFMDDSYYPTGGFSEITNRGSFENLVLSELIYMGEGTGIGSERVQGEIDLFDLRFVEGELLFYTRDSGQLHRKRRTLRLILDLRKTLSIKYPEHPYQLGTMAAGLILALVRDLELLFNNDALQFVIHLWAGEEAVAAEKLSETLSILLAAPIQHGALEIVTEKHIKLASLGAYQRKTYALVFTADPGRVRTIAALIDDLRTGTPPLFTTVIDLSTRNNEDAHERVLRLGQGESALADLKHQVLLDIMHSRRRRQLQVDADADEATAQ